MEFGRVVFAVGVIKDPFLGNSRKRHPSVILDRLPRAQAFFQLLRKHRRVPGGLERFLRHLAGGLMIAVAVGTPADKNGSDHQRTCDTDRSHYIGQHAIVSPVIQTLLFGFRKAIIDYPSPKLLNAIVLIGGEKLLGPDQPECVEVVGRHYVGPALSPV